MDISLTSCKAGCRPRWPPQSPISGPNGKPESAGCPKTAQVIRYRFRAGWTRAYSGTPCRVPFASAVSAPRPRLHQTGGAAIFAPSDIGPIMPPHTTGTVNQTQVPLHALVLLMVTRPCGRAQSIVITKGNARPSVQQGQSDVNG